MLDLFRKITERVSDENKIVLKYVDIQKVFGKVPHSGYIIKLKY